MSILSYDSVCTEIPILSLCLGGVVVEPNSQGIEVCVCKMWGWGKGIVKSFPALASF